MSQRDSVFLQEAVVLAVVLMAVVASLAFFLESVVSLLEIKVSSLLE